MRRRRFFRGSRLTRSIFALALLTLLLALGCGGGQGSLAESLLALLGLALVILSGYRLYQSRLRLHTAAWFWLLPLALLALPLAQLLPLPDLLAGHLPGRADLLSGLDTAGAARPAGRWSLVPLATERMLWSALVPAGLFMASSVLHGAQRRVMIVLTLIFAAVSAFAGLWQIMMGPGSALYLYDITNAGDAVGFFANRNHLAALLAVSVPVAVGMLADRLRHHGHGFRDGQPWLYAFLLVLLCVGVTATHSRAGYVMLMAGVLASAVIVVRIVRRGRSRRALRVVQVAAVAGVAVVAVAALAGLMQRLNSDPLEDERWTMAANTARAAAPALGGGFGFGSFVHAYDEVGDGSAETPMYANHAHDDYLELWLEGGLLALALVALVYAIVARRVHERLAASHQQLGSDARHRGLMLGATCAVALLAVHSMVDYPLRTISLAAYAGLLVAVLMGSVRRRSRLAPPGVAAGRGSG